MARWFLILLLVTVAVLLIVFEADALFVLFGGVLLAVFLKTVADALVRVSRMPYRLAVVEIVLILVGSAVVLALSAGPRLVQQMSNLIQALPAALHNGEGYAKKYLGDGWATTATASNLKPAANTIVAGAGGAVLGSVQAAAGLIVIGFMGLYGALSPRAYARVALAVVPPQHRVRARQVMTETVHRLGRWLVGRAVAMAFVGVATSVGLWALHVPLALALGVLAGALAFIDYFGAIASAIPPILLALGKSPTTAAWVVVLFFGVHLVEGYLLTPFIARTAVHFPPGYTLALQALFGALFGILGLTFATPTGIVLVTIVELLYVRDVLGERTLPPLPKPKPT